MEADILFSLECIIVEKFRVHGCAFAAISLSGEVQSKHSTEGNTCMTSSEDNRVSIPPKSQGSACQIPGAVIHLSNGHLILWMYTGFSA